MLKCLRVNYMNKKEKVITAILAVVLAAGCIIIALSIKSSMKKVPVTTTAGTSVTTTSERAVLYSSQIEKPSADEAFGRITCERLGIDCDLIWGDSNYDLSLGACQDDDTALPGSSTPALIGGHRNTVFLNLQYAEVGDIIKITTSYGEYEYTVDKIEIIDVNTFDYGILDKTDYQALIYACYPFKNTSYQKTQRLMCFCKLTSGPLIMPG